MPSSLDKTLAKLTQRLNWLWLVGLEGEVRSESRRVQTLYSFFLFPWDVLRRNNPNPCSKFWCWAGDQTRHLLLDELPEQQFRDWTCTQKYKGRLLAYVVIVQNGCERLRLVNDNCCAHLKEPWMKVLVLLLMGPSVRRDRNLKKEPFSHQRERNFSLNKEIGLNLFYLS